MRPGAQPAASGGTALLRFRYCSCAHGASYDVDGPPNDSLVDRPEMRWKTHKLLSSGTVDNRRPPLKDNNNMLQQNGLAAFTFTYLIEDV